ncbi:tRNA adenosine(34) deaminase TadA [Candidatus Pandoraea novymonadis]|uniref:tRNA-specific adenosine deaminase n=1 Tax=Candidatus Pandoraea novymonadis TaxID=1808959 RepID=A0ABX5FEY0_9BURK|nr:tRNA adenosine(34) deaminase TadA [Candidatus Pandoraea novymonadis]PSB92008.1 tRNA-specific adenosine deaminase [Candidatus Pandoraea novymonadis]
MINASRDISLIDCTFMQAALAQANFAMAKGEVPVGAVVVHDGSIIASGHNAPVSQHDPSAHAEMQALRAAAKILGNYRLPDCELYVTLEPCIMCAGLIMHSRLRRLVFGAFDHKGGACGSVIDLFSEKRFNHHANVIGGVMDDQCVHILQAFFVKKRAVVKAIRSCRCDNK